MKNLLSRTKSGRRKGSLGLVLDSDAAEQAASTNGAAAAPAPADAVDDASHATVEGAKGAAEAKGEPEPAPPARPARRLPDAKGVEPGRYGDGDESPTTPLFAGPPPSPGGLVDQTEEELRNLREALFTVKTALVEMRTRSSLVSDSCDSDDARAPL